LLKSRTARLASALTLAASVVGFAAAPAWAGYVDLAPYGWIYQNGNLGARHSLTSVDGTSYNAYALACVTAFNASDGSQAGTSDCEPQGTLAVHYYNGTLRNGFLYASPNVQIAGSGFENY